MRHAPWRTSGAGLRLRGDAVLRFVGQRLSGAMEMDSYCTKDGWRMGRSFVLFFFHLFFFFSLVWIAYWLQDVTGKSGVLLWDCSPFEFSMVAGKGDCTTEDINVHDVRLATHGSVRFIFSFCSPSPSRPPFLSYRENSCSSPLSILSSPSVVFC